MSRSDRHTHYSFVDIERYLRGEMSPSEMHALEKAALQDSFLADAIEGYELADRSTVANDLSELRGKLAATKAETKVVDLHSRTPWLRIAALLILIAGVAAASWKLFFAGGNRLKENSVAVVAPVQNPPTQDKTIARDTGLPAKAGTIASISTQQKHTVPKIEADDAIKENEATPIQENSLHEVATTIPVARQSYTLPTQADTVPAGNVLAENREAVNQVLQGKVAGVAIANAKAKAERARRSADDALKKQIVMMSTAAKDTTASLLPLRGAGENRDAATAKISMVNITNTATVNIGAGNLSNLTVTGMNGLSAYESAGGVTNLTSTGNLTIGAAPIRPLVKSDTVTFTGVKGNTFGYNSKASPFPLYTILNPGPGVLEPDGGWVPFSKSFAAQVKANEKKSFTKNIQFSMLFSIDPTGKVIDAFFKPVNPATLDIPADMRKRAVDLFLKGPRWKYLGIYQAARVSVPFKW